MITVSAGVVVTVVPTESCSSCRIRQVETVAMYFGQPAVNIRESLPDKEIPPIEMGDGAAPVTGGL
jgi:hypothetical protein